MEKVMRPEKEETLVIGCGQAGLSVGYHLKKRGMPFLILDGSERIGDTWRKRWDSLRLFTPAKYSRLAGMPFPAPAWSFPTKDEMGDYLEAYAERFDIPVKLGQRVSRLCRRGEKYVVETKDRRYEADNVIVAMANYQEPKRPAFASELDPGIVKLHSSDYRNLDQLQGGDVLIVGAGNSGAELAKEFAGAHKVWISGRDVGQIPFRVEKWTGRMLAPVVLRGLFHRVLTTRTPMGRRVRPKVLTHSGPLIRVKSKDLDAMGVERVPKMAGVRDGKPQMEDGRVLDVANVVWCTGFHPDFSWIDLPVIGEHEPDHSRGVVGAEPGLYFVGLHFQYSLSSTMIHGVGRDAEHIVKAVERRMGGRGAAVS